MSLGSSNDGPPASAKQMDYLAALLRKAGYDDYRQARGPLGLTQRQGRGKFSRREASALIDQLVGDDDGGGVQPTLDTAGPASTAAPSVQARSRSRDGEPLTAFSDVALAAELERRGWTVTPPR